ncbi:hypothetical protein D3C76_1395310 [compost metagenome]
MAIRGIGDGLWLSVAPASVQHRALQVRGQQGGVEHSVLSQMLRQQQVTLLDNGVFDGTLYLGGQTAFAVEAMTFRGIGQIVAGETIKRVIAITAIQDFLRG